MSDREQLILDGETDDITPAASIAAGLVATTVGGEFVVKVWSPTADWDSATVSIYILAQDNTPILLQAFTEDGAYFGRVGSDERITVGVADVAGASADLDCTVSRSR